MDSHSAEGQRDEAGGEEDEDEEEGSGSWSEDDGHLLGATLNGDALARSLVDTQTANELGLVRSEVRRLRNKIKKVEREKDDMAEDFRNTTRILLNRIKELEAEVSGFQSRPQTAAVIERIEGSGAASGSRGLARPPLPGGLGTGPGSRPGTSQVMRIEEADEPPASPPRMSETEANRLPPASGTAESQDGETTICGNCRRNIPAGNVLAHSVSCYRNNTYCDACDQVIPLSDKESHAAEWTDPERLVNAVAQRDIEKVQRMLGHNADICGSVHPQTRDSTMHAAARLGDEELVAFLTAHGVDIDPVNAQGETPLHLACGVAVEVPGTGPAPAVKLLVELGASLNTLNGRGESPLMLLCRRGVAQSAKYLVEMRADTEVCNSLGDTPLQMAQRNGHQETVLALCTAGAPLRLGTPIRSAERRSSTASPPAGADGEVAFFQGSSSSGLRARSGSPMPGSGSGGAGGGSGGRSPGFWAAGRGASRE
eukprot:CAMPEP_0115268604 /NCGR_PEP_ID=MMETSP0270-20121206/52605_1 /TAXON_ID=71861 /ORGANISM="Scrippsiella trochoidea, Strain CCMP3099" /LENGTH=483 /DNA_ID=CAMNT_0002684809 /DNA_START=47 /DNA_END=1495 /DNA_ORIENTATION=+